MSTESLDINEAFCRHSEFRGSGAASKVSSFAKLECGGWRLDSLLGRLDLGCGPWYAPGHTVSGGPGGPWKWALKQLQVPTDQGIHNGGRDDVVLHDGHDHA